MYPTRRAVLLCAAGVPLAVVAGVLAPQAWFVGLVWTLFVVVLIGLDLLLAPSGPELRIGLPGHVGVGEAFTLELRLDRKGDRRPVEVAVARSPLLEGPVRATIGGDADTARLELTPRRRGMAIVDEAWLRWTGALGLAWRQRRERFDARVRIIPDVRAVRTDGLRLLQDDALFGLIAQLRPGEGAEFESLTEYRPGMDRRAIDWKQSARHFDLLVKEFRTERNNNIVFAVDTGRTMCEPLAGVPRIDRAVSAALVAAYVALKTGDRVRLFGFASHPQFSSGTIAGVTAFAKLQRLAAELDYRHEETNFTLGLSTLAAQLDRRALVVVFTEIADPTGTELMLRAAGRLLDRHLLLFVVLRDDELDALLEAEPVNPADVTRAAAAATLVRERRIVISRLRRLGIQVLETSHDRAAVDLVRRYLDIKRRGLL